MVRPDVDGPNRHEGRQDHSRIARRKHVPNRGGILADRSERHQNRQINGTKKTDTMKNQISRGNPSFQ
jgi:hypothetical protein